MEQIYFTIAAVVYGIFIIRFILSCIGGDIELDGDLDLGDVVSFKGLIHFLMGLFGWLSVKGFLTHSIQWYDYLIGFVVGLIFVIVLFYVYKFMMKLESKPTILLGNDLIGHSGTIYFKNYTDKNTGLHHYIITINNGGGTVELSAISKELFHTGDSITIKNYSNSYYII